jgi:hypothetical protein
MTRIKATLLLTLFLPGIIFAGGLIKNPNMGYKYYSPGTVVRFDEKGMIVPAGPNDRDVAGLVLFVEKPDNDSLYNYLIGINGNARVALECGIKAGDKLTWGENGKLVKVKHPGQPIVAIAVMDGQCEEGAQNTNNDPEIEKIPNIMLCEPSSFQRNQNEPGSYDRNQKPKDNDNKDA